MRVRWILGDEPQMGQDEPLGTVGTVLGTPNIDGVIMGSREAPGPRGGAGRGGAGLASRRSLRL